MNYGQYFTVVILMNSHNYSSFLNCFSSLSELNGFPERLIMVFDPYNSNYDPLFDIEEIRKLDMIKTSYRMGTHIHNVIAKTYNTPYIIQITDDLVFRDSDFYRKLYETHQNSSQIRFSDGINGLSLTRGGSHKSSDKFYQFDPYLAYRVRKTHNQMNGNV